DQPHITSVHLDWANNVAHVGYHAEMIGPTDIEAIIAGTGCACAPADGGQGHAGLVQPSQARRLHRLWHAVDVQPISMGTKHDRMQYELPATQPRPSHTALGAAAPTPAMDHQGHAGMDHATHAGMDHALPAGHPMAGKETTTAIDHSAHAGMDHSAH